MQKQSAVEKVEGLDSAAEFTVKINTDGKVVMPPLPEAKRGKSGFLYSDTPQQFETVKDFREDFAKTAQTELQAATSIAAEAGIKEFAPVTVIGGHVKTERGGTYLRIDGDDNSMIPKIKTDAELTKAIHQIAEQTLTKSIPDTDPNKKRAIEAWEKDWQKRHAAPSETPAIPTPPPTPPAPPSQKPAARGF